MRIKPLGWLVIVGVLVLCLVGAWLAASSGGLPGLSPQQPATNTAPAAAANTATSPAQATAANTQPAPSATQAAASPTTEPEPTSAPTDANRETLTVAFDAFGPYLSVVQILAMENRSYDLVLVPFGLGGNDFTEDER